VPDTVVEQRIATLWHLAWNETQLSCAVYRLADRFQLRVETRTTTIVAEPFDLQPRAMARAKALRESLKRRGWRDDPPAER
jgi:hypothetical protein